MGLCCFKVQTAEALRRFYRLRFQVYCRECGYLKEQNYPEGVESDDYDPSSVHFCATDKAGNLIAGVRLILPECGRFPIESACQDLDLARLGIRREECSEISRLVVSRKRHPEAGSRAAFRVSPAIDHLCTQMYEECRARGIRYCLAMMTAPLHQLLKRRSYHFQKIGRELDYLGKVYPYIMDIEKMFRTDVSVARRSSVMLLARG